MGSRAVIVLDAGSETIGHNVGSFMAGRRAAKRWADGARLFWLWRKKEGSPAAVFSHEMFRTMRNNTGAIIGEGKMILGGLKSFFETLQEGREQKISDDQKSFLKTDFSLAETTFDPHAPAPPAFIGGANWRGKRMTKLERQTCGDCGVLEGQNHEPGCDLERCPICSHQLISCGHEKEVLAYVDHVPFIEYPQMCAKCGEMWPDMFMVPDDEWEQYIGKGERDKMLCRSCFDQIKAWIDEEESEESISF